MSLLFQAPAKVNLTLEVLARRADGYHGIRSVMVPLGLADRIIVSPSERFEFACSVAELDAPDNLVVRAFKALGELPPVRIDLEKIVPSQAGLGGGSSDAASVLLASMDGAFGDPGQVDWIAVARGLGSDVPFFLAKTAALVEGTGERVTPAGALPPWHVLVIKPPVAVSTADAYRRLDELARETRPRNESASIALLTALQRGEFAEVERLMQNDFEAVVAAGAPEVARALDALRAAGAGNALLAGSGSCVFTLAQTAREIETIGERLDLPQTFLRFPTSFAAAPAWRA
jgi:4-diphosphocytidyl-2-C-methyl-D-erythritol kinase